MGLQRFIILYGILGSITLILSISFSMFPVKKVIDIERYPARAITMIVPYGVGGTMDLVVRSMEKSVMRHMGQPLIIRNISGASCMSGWNELAGSEPDGYTVGLVNSGAILQPLYGQTRYHYMSALEPIAQINLLPQLIAVRSDAPWDNINDFIAYAKKHPCKIKYGHSGLGGPKHVLGEILAKEAGIDIVQVPFIDGGAETVAALLGGHIQMIIASPTVLKEQLRVGRVKILAVADEQRLTDPLYKNVPTLKEQGINVVLRDWLVIATPKRLSSDVKYKLAAKLREVINDPEFMQYMENLGLTVDYLGPDACIDKWLAENEKLSQFIKGHGIAELVTKQRYGG